MRVYRLSHRVSHAYVDVLGELKVSGLLGLLEQAAIEASADVGYDALRYQQAGRVWIIRRTTLERLRPVGGVHTLEVQTHVADFRRARSLRRYEVHSGGVEVARAVTDWVYCDISSGRPSRVGADVVEALTEGAAVPALPRPEDLPPHGMGAALTVAVEVRPSHLDHITHVNNGVYADFIEDSAFALFAAESWPLARMLEQGGAMGLRHLDIEYYADARLGDELGVSTWRRQAPADPDALPAPAELVHVIRRADGEELVRATSRWAWRTRAAVLGWPPVEG